MGFGNNIKLAIKKYGIENFSKTILYIFDNSVECYEKEAELVNENFVARHDTYNMHVGGHHGPISNGEDHWAYGKKRPSISKLMTDNNPSTLPHVRKMLSETKVVKLACGEYGRVPLDNTEHENINTGKVTVRDKDGKCFSVCTNDPRFISGELEAATKGRMRAKDKYGNNFFIRNDDPRFISGELVGANSGRIKCMDKNGKVVHTTIDDERFNTGELLKRTHRHFTVIDKDGIEYYVTPEDERYVNRLFNRNTDKVFNAIDSNLNSYKINRHDQRYINGIIWAPRKGDIYTCPHCNLSSTGKSVLVLKHFNNCKHKRN